MDVREKLVELLGADICKYNYCEDCECFENEEDCFATIKYSMADHLIANGVTVQECGQWIIGVDNDDFDVKCSKCEWTDTFEVAGIAAVERIAKAMHYCPNCGARMDGGEE